jgi:two-component system cell cycle response regulator
VPGASRVRTRSRRKESRGCKLSTNGEPIHILLVGEAGEARRLRDLLETNGLNQFRITHIHDIEPAAECLVREGADVLLLDIGPDQSWGREIIQAAASAAARVPTVILSESESESLAVELLRQGAQDFLTKGRLDRELLARSLRYAIERHRLQKTLHSLSLLDELTGLHNRRGFLALAEQHLRLILRKGAALLVFVDLDGLKSINDTHGHLEGNNALTRTADILRACFRQSDILARLGGDEFCVLMTDACQGSAEQVGKRLQERVDLTNATPGSRFRLSLSVGIADVPPVRQPPLEELLRLADGLMYEQKRGKRAHASDPVSLRHLTPA